MRGKLLAFIRSYEKRKRKQRQKQNGRNGTNAPDSATNKRRNATPNVPNVPTEEDVDVPPIRTGDEVSHTSDALMCDLGSVTNVPSVLSKTQGTTANSLAFNSGKSWVPSHLDILSVESSFSEMSLSTVTDPEVAAGAREVHSGHRSVSLFSSIDQEEMRGLVPVPPVPSHVAFGSRTNIPIQVTHKDVLLGVGRQSPLLLWRIGT